MNAIEAIQAGFAKIEKAFADKSALVDENAKLKAENAQLKAEAETLRSNANDMQGALDETMKENETLKTEKADAEAKATQLQATIDDPEGEITKRATAIATSKITAAGFTEDDTGKLKTAMETSDSGETLHEQYLAIKDPREASIFWEKNKEAMRASAVLR